jgi:mannose-6-phosphate isomerase-like protein (cupin superfamily)
MNEPSFLSGKVRRFTLPGCEGPAGPGAPPLKRMLLPQGELAQFHDDDEPIHYMAFIELREGTERGNHYHEVKEEFIYLIEGELLLLIEDITSKARETVPLRAGELVFITTNVAHTLRVLKAGRAVEFSRARFDPGDTCRYPIT